MPTVVFFPSKLQVFNQGVGEDGFVLGSVGESKSTWHICGKELMHLVFK